MTEPQPQPQEYKGHVLSVETWTKVVARREELENERKAGVGI